ncbi:protein crumbs homolog 3b [Engraulis encrasicolus]|uniref:protein crumbs homolog 3b n=1 Tax=Engraulis encrasicolus TaxID=184585 RepID=UPI002FD39D11
MLTVVHGAGGLLFPLALLLVTVLGLLVCAFPRRRRQEGSYQPSHEEKKQAHRQHKQQQQQHPHSAERPGLTLPLPKEERLI